MSTDINLTFPSTREHVSKEHRHRHKSSSSSSSLSASSSKSTTDSDASEIKTRCKKKKQRESKFSIRKFNRNDKDVKRLSCIELIYASLMWLLKRNKKLNMSQNNILGVVGHIAYLALQAIPGMYTDSAFRGYDKDVRQLARDNGCPNSN